ncbi:indole-3-glycerol phosphate synthase TrpC [Candidatus Karelsulcia muelleri]|uniref:indole-3-glycerol phosphate synthase TrpC n=1 Tax=Candidatus Karelsulcia muelleri TaxID=336810 RepID=UPI002167576E|nr:indole-3-glycerol phosphate synthase TrpC [Candidatus Karelsulcia muelleri]
MNFIKKNIERKKKDIIRDIKKYSIQSLEKKKIFKRKCLSLKERIKYNNIGIISEFKRKSPSKDFNKKNLILDKICKEYQEAGSIGISILTDNKFFLGSSKDLSKIRKKIFIPILRKDFIIDEHQIIHSKAIGADAILLIAKILDKKKIKFLSTLAKSLGLEVILELHDKKDISKISYDIDILGINNRDLSTFNVDIHLSKKLYSLIPKKFQIITESGIYNIENIIDLYNLGFNGFLIGEKFLSSFNPGNYCKKFIKNIFYV